MWGMLLWIIECAKSNGHGLDEWAWSRWPPRPLEAKNLFFPDMPMWGMLLWVIECAKLNGHGLDGLRGRWRPLEADNFFFQI